MKVDRPKCGCGKHKTPMGIVMDPTTTNNFLLSCLVDS